MGDMETGATRVYTDDGQEWRVSETAHDLAALGGPWVLASAPSDGRGIAIPLARIVAIVDEPEGCDA